MHKRGLMRTYVNKIVSQSVELLVRYAADKRTDRQTDVTECFQYVTTAT